MRFGLNSGIGVHLRMDFRPLMLSAGLGAVALAGPAFAQTYGSGPPPQQYHAEKDTSVTAVNQRPDANRVMQMHRVRMQMQRFTVANLERRRQLLADSARLLQVAAELNVEFQKAGDADPSLASKADLIEKLAHAVQEKMKLTVGPE